MPAAKLSAAAYAEIRSGVLSVREAKRKYKISQRRCQRIRKGECDVVAQPHEVQDADAEDNFRVFLECFPQSCISFRELHILEEFGHSIYGRRSIPRQFLENYTLFAKEFVAQGWIVDIVLVAAPGKSPVQAFCRYVLAPEDKLPQFAGKQDQQGQHTRCEDCLEVSQNRQNFLLERIGNCRCGSNSHCTESKKCVLWTQRDAHVPAGPREPIPELEIPQQIRRDLVVENIENKDDHCLYWSLRWSRMCESGERLSKACPCRKKDCIFALMCGMGLETTTACTTFLADNGGVGRIEVPPPPKRRQRKALDIPEGIYCCDAFAVEKVAKCNRVVLRICYKGEEQFVYGSGIQVAVGEIGGIEWLRCMETGFEVLLGGIGADNAKHAYRKAKILLGSEAEDDPPAHQGANACGCTLVCVCPPPGNSTTLPNQQESPPT
ncbi:MAG: hypothetical protein G8D86_19295 [gamma proteobacterium symbiont of Ctena orbiculata]